MPAAGCCARIAIVGGGFGGIATAVKLEQRGIHDFVVFERSPEPGGTWYDNTYPGCEVDVPSRVYSFSFMPYDWSRTHCGAAELQQYARDMVDRFALRSRFRFGTTVEEVRWIDVRKCYEVRLEDGSTEEFAVVVSAVGFLNNPKYPDWDGLDEFTGPAFHTARWEHDHVLTGRTIALVGTGSTAIQLTPELAAIAKHLYVFQREPGWIIPKWSGRYSRTRRALYARFPMAHLLARFCWWVYFETLGRSAFRVGSLTNRTAQKACRYYIRRQIKDPHLRSQVTPDHPFGCKRPIWADTFYPALERADVTLVPHAVERVTADSVVTVEGDKFPVDVLVMATGFLPQQYLRSLPLRGRAGHTLAETWKESPRALLGLTVPGFPNFFILYGPNTNGGSAITFNLERQAEVVARTVARMRRRRIEVFDTRRGLFERYTRWIDRQNAKRFDVALHCNNYYFAPDGRNVTQWPRGGIDYWVLTRILMPLALVPVPARQRKAGSPA